MSFIFPFLSYFVFHTILEFIYFSFTMKKHHEHMAHIQNVSVSQVKFKGFWPWGLLGFLIYFVSVAYFLIYPLLKSAREKKIKNKAEHEMGLSGWMLKASVLSFAIYGIFNVSNIVTLQRYKIDMAAIDMLWGFLSLNVISLIGFFVFPVMV